MPDATLERADSATTWLRSEDSWETGVAVLPDGRIVTTRRGFTVWDPNSRTCVGTWHASGIYDTETIAASPVAPLIAFHTRRTENVWIVDVDALEVRHVLPLTQPSRAIAFSPNGKWLATGGGYEYRDDAKDPVVRVWDVASGELLYSLKGLRKCVQALAWDGAGERVIAGYGKAARMWTLVEDGEPRKRPRAAVKLPIPGPAGAFAFVPGSDEVLIAGGHTIARVHPLSREVRWQMEWNTVPIEACNAIHITPYGAVANVVDKLLMLDVETGREVWQAAGPRGFKQLTVTPDGETVVARGLAKAVWRVASKTGKRIE